MDELKKELKELNRLKQIDEIQFENKLAYISDTFTTEDNKKYILEYLQNMLTESAETIDAFIEQANVKLQLENISEMVSLSYIAQKYFNKSRNWIYQKINGNIVNGKPSKFTEDEVNTLNFALQDIGKSISSTVIRL